MRRNRAAQLVSDKDQALAILREATEPLRARDVGAGMNYIMLLPCHKGEIKENGTEYSCRAERNYGVSKTVHTDDGMDMSIRDWGSSASSTPALNSLLKDGLVTREKRGNQWYWSIADVDLVSLDDMPPLVDVSETGRETRH